MPPERPTLSRRSLLAGGVAVLVALGMAAPSGGPARVVSEPAVLPEGPWLAADLGIPAAEVLAFAEELHDLRVRGVLPELPSTVRPR